MFMTMGSVGSGSPFGDALSTSTASSALAFLQEDDVELKGLALKSLLETVDTAWHEMAPVLADLEALAEENSSLPLAVRQDAAALASRVFFYLEEFDQALRLALQAGPDHISVEQAATSPYVQRLVSAALDAYVAARKQEFEAAEEASEPHAAAASSTTKSSSLEEDGATPSLSVAQLQGLVYKLLDAACEAGHYSYALGVTLESREAERFESILKASGPTLPLLQYATHTALTAVPSKTFRHKALTVIAKALQERFAAGNKEDAYDLVRVTQWLGQSEVVARVLYDLLLSKSDDDFLLALQLAFDLMDTDDTGFCSAVAKALQKHQMQLEEEQPTRYASLQRVLVGGFLSEMALSFLYKQSAADRLIMEQLKRTMEERSSGSRSSLLHSAAVMTHAYLYAGTTQDAFLRDHLDWMKKASNWAKFSATASLGVVHAAHVTEATHLLQPYLPATPEADGVANVSPAGGYAEGGSLYALGLIHGSASGSSAEKRRETTEFIRTHLRASHANEVMSHGAALGVGLTAMGSADLAVVLELKDLLDTDSAVAGEATGMAIGMVLVGTGAANPSAPTLQLPAQHREEILEVVAELKNYARETQHEKIIRGIAMGLALMCFGQEENADAAIEEMRSDRDPVMRYGAQYAMALAYCGTGSNKAIRILLHTAVSDVSDDVRMAAVIGLAFVLFKTPERVPQLVNLLLESFNPHVRYGACMAVGIAMAGTGDSDSIALLDPMLEDMTDYVRQGALMGTAMIYMQQSDACNGRRIKSFRERLSTIVSEKHQSNLTKMGAILSTGILDAGGRNCTLILGSRNGFVKRSSAVGLALWLQYWHWYPMMHMFSLALTPTYTIGLNQHLKFPKKFEVVCNAKPSQFAYPKKLEEKKEEKKKRVETVTLSITAKEKARLARKRAKLGGSVSAMEVDEEKTDEKPATTPASGGDEEAKAGDAMDVDGTNKEEEGETPEPIVKKKKKREPEPTSFRVGNPSRMTKSQSAVCAFDLDQRYRPIRPFEKPFGVILLTDSTPTEEEELGAVMAPSLEPEGELPPPEPFEWTPPPYVAPEAATTEPAVKSEEGEGDGNAMETEEEGKTDA